MPTTRNVEGKLPGAFEDLVRVMPPRAIQDDGQLETSIEMIDRLMASGKLTKGQRIYLETLVQLVEVYEAQHHAIDTSGITGIESLESLLEENDMSASDLARLLGVHPSMGSKILRGERFLTVKHLRKLAARFGVGAELFIDERAPTAPTRRVSARSAPSGAEHGGSRRPSPSARRG